MKNPILLLFLIFSLTAAQAASVASSAFTPGSLRTNGLADPLGVDTPASRLGWMLENGDPAARGNKQTAYQIIVASSPALLGQDKGDLWDSGKVVSDQSINVPYAGKALTTLQGACWKVRVWDQNQRATAWSPTGRWTMGLLAPADWHAQWIGHDQPPLTTNTPTPARWLRKEFTAGKPIRRALVAFAGLGTSELYVNGAKVGDAVLSPALSDYEKRIYYVTYDVTLLLKPGANALGVVLGNGRFQAPRVAGRNGLLSYGWPKLILQLRVEYQDGTSAEITSDDSWKYTEDGPIRANNEYDGEDYNAQKEMPGWAAPGFNDAAWTKASLVNGPGGVLCAQNIEPLRVTGIVKPASVKEVTSGVFIYDFGQNFVGWCRLNVTGPAGTTVQMRFAERLHDDGTLSVENLRTAKVTDRYTLKGGGEETWQPRFTYHGFRYVEVTGFPGQPTLAALDGRVVNDDLERIGDFESSNGLLNKIYQCVVWGVRGNYRSIPTDCPQRDERQGWLGDRAVESLGEMYIFNNDLLYAKWLQDIVDAQREDGSVPAVAPHYWTIYNDDVTWPSALVLIPDSLHLAFGDELPIRQNYPAMVKWVDHMSGYITDNLMPRDKYGDWCMPPETPKIIHSTDPARLTAGPLLGTTYFYHDLSVLGDFAKMTNQPADAQRFADLAAKMDFGLNAKYLNRQLGRYDNGTQTSSALPLAFGMVPEDQRARVFSALVDSVGNIYHNHIGTGLIGAAWINRVLTDNGRIDLAYAIATNHDFPSWGYMVEHGATTVWELWNGDTADVQMNSGNHVMLVGDLVIWLYQDLAGITPDPTQPGFKNILMKPMPAGDLTSVKASHRSPYGLIESEWHKDGPTFRWHITVPPNSTGTVFVPANSADSVREGNRSPASRPGIKFLRFDAGRAVYQLDSGTYEFQSTNSPTLP
jgi:alpha-L-rhamnosidase